LEPPQGLYTDSQQFSKNDILASLKDGIVEDDIFFEKRMGQQIQVDDE